jgi:hypothetical protein
VTIGNYPGIEARLRRQGALIYRLVEEAGICERCAALRSGRIPRARRAGALLSAAALEESWRTLFYANLVSSFIGEI